MSVLYHSKTGNTQAMAEALAAAMATAEGAESRAMSIEAVDGDFLTESRCILLGTPVYYADQSGETKQWLEQSLKAFAPAGKLGGAFATCDYIHGGGELALRAILDHMMVSGMLVYSGGGAQGKPVVHLGPVGWAGHMEDCREAIDAYGRRFAAKALELF